MARVNATDREIEERYQAGTLRLSQEKNDFLLPQIIDFAVIFFQGHKPGIDQFAKLLAIASKPLVLCSH